MSDILGVTNADYHANKSHLSSSQLKLILADRARFYKEVVLGEVERQDKAAFREGSMLHTLILEPEKIGEYVVYNGLRRAGKAFEEFKELHKGKTILIASELMRAERMYAAYAALPAAVELLKPGLSEHNMVSEILSVPVKARADRINIDAGYITDVKSTSLPSSPDIFKETVREFSYDLSAALYAAIAAQVYKKKFDFYWVVVSKADDTCNVYKASALTMAMGHEKVLNALNTYKQCMESGIWKNEFKIEPVQRVITDYTIEEV